MRIVSVESKEVDDHVRLSALVIREPTGRPIELFIDIPSNLQGLVRADAEPFVPVLLIPCMLEGRDLTCDLPLSNRMLKGAAEVQNALIGMFGLEMSRVRILAESREDRRVLNPPASASFFSLGVDSYYSVLKARPGPDSFIPPVTALIYFNGLEFPLGQERPDQSLSALRLTADALRMNLVVGRTNFRDHFDLPWGRFYHGAVLCSIALSLAGSFNHVLIPASYALREMVPWGSHPCMDPWWSCNGVDIHHDGVESTRSEKTERLIAHHPIVLSNLRVCLNPRDTASNCGRCGKCLRTMICLEILGALDRCDSFPHRFPDDLEDLLEIRSNLDLCYGQDNLILAGRLGFENPRTKILRYAVRRYLAKQARDQYLANASLVTRYVEMSALGRLYRLFIKLGLIPARMARRIAL
jgi:hypothetical protein